MSRVRVEPYSFIMTANKCDYCYNTDTKSVLYQRLYGIKACEEHYEWASHDMKAYFQENDMVAFKDAMLNPAVKEFIESLGDEFEVKRSSGVVEKGWRINKGCTYTGKKYFQYDECGGWSFPAKIGENEDIITKNVALSYYPNSDAAIKALDDGIYKIDISGTVSQYKEVPGIGRVIVDNEVIRVLLHSP
jgi:hypothetical protein